MVQLELRQLSIPSGERVIITNISWQEFEAILEELGDRRAARLAYDNGTLEIMTPLPEHEDNKEIIGDLVKALLEELDIEFRSLGSTNFKNRIMAQGVEQVIAIYLDRSKTAGRNATLKAFRTWVREYLASK